MPKKILTVGLYLAGDDIEFAAFTEKKSLLDWDIVLFRPDVSRFIARQYDNSEYKGKLSLNDRMSFEMREANAHWRREISHAVEAGKLVVGFLPPPGGGLRGNRHDIYVRYRSQSEGYSTRRASCEL